MCGPTVNVVHLFVIGPVILLSTYYEWKLPLYVLGVGVMLIHGMKFIERNWDAGPSLQTVPTVGLSGNSGGSRNVQSFAPAPKRESSGCSGGCGGYR